MISIIVFDILNSTEIIWRFYEDRQFIYKFDISLKLVAKGLTDTILKSPLSGKIKPKNGLFSINII